MLFLDNRLRGAKAPKLRAKQNSPVEQIAGDGWPDEAEMQRFVSEVRLFSG